MAALKLGLVTAGYVVVLGVLGIAVLSLGKGPWMPLPELLESAVLGGVSGILGALGLIFWAGTKGRGRLPSRGTFQWVCSAVFIIYFLSMDVMGWIHFPGLFGLSEIRPVSMSLLVGLTSGQAMGNVLHHIVAPSSEEPVGPEKSVVENFPPTQRVGLDLPTSIVAPSLQDLRKSDHASAPTWRIEGGG